MAADRYTLATLDNTITDLAVEADGARKMAQEAQTRAERLESAKARLMEVRDAVRISAPQDATVFQLREAVEALVDVMPYCHPNPNSPHAEKWEEWRQAALDKAALALGGEGL